MQFVYFLGFFHYLFSISLCIVLFFYLCQRLNIYYFIEKVTIMWTILRTIYQPEAWQVSIKLVGI